MSKNNKLFRDYPYAVFVDGIIKRVDTGKILTQTINLDGYRVVTLFKNGKRKQFKSHRVIAELYCEGYSENKVVNHKDGNKLNNSIDNLEWVTPRENMVHAISSDLFSNKIHPKEAIKMRKLLVRGCSKYGIIPLSRKFNVHPVTISRIVNHKCWDDLLINEIKEFKEGVLHE